MIRDNYKQVFSVSLLHSYYKNGLCNGAILQPDIATQQLFTRFNFLLKNTELHTGAKTPLPDLLTYITQTTKATSFRFSLIARDPHFLLITQLPIDHTGSMIYESGEGLHLKGVFKPAPTADCIGTLTVHFADIINTPQFIISFQARSTCWQYYIINNTQFSYNNLSINNAGFGNPENVITDNGNKALLFSSLQPIPLSQDPAFQLDLVYSRNTVTKTLYKGLPQPNPSQFGLIGRQISSPMYVYL